MTLHYMHAIEGSELYPPKVREIQSTAILPNKERPTAPGISFEWDAEGGRYRESFIGSDGAGFGLSARQPGMDMSRCDRGIFRD